MGWRGEGRSTGAPILLVHRGCGMEVMVSKSAPKRGGNDSVNFRVRIDCGFNEFFVFV